MAMLAEPRRKLKYSINPRGTHWSNDDDKFGQKLMEKYGWSKGKGLGANEDGRVENVGIKMKSDNKGVGCTKKFADKWIEHQDDFNDLLQALNQDQNNSGDSHDQKIVSLEKKSETSRKRVHYMKFTKGKDLSSRSKEDLECIFGTKKHKKKTKVEEEIVEEEIVEEVKVTTNETHDTDHGVKTFTNTCNIQEYFALKMKQRKQAMMTSDNNNQSNSFNGIAAESSDSNQSALSNDVIVDQSETVLQDKKSLKRKRVSFNLNYDLFEFDKDSNIISQNVENEVDEDTPKKSKKKKKLKSEAVSDEDENADEEDFVKIKKKKKKSKVTEKEESEETTEILKSPKKKKKSKKSKNSEDEESDIIESPKRKRTKYNLCEEKLPEYHNVRFYDDSTDSAGDKNKKTKKNNDLEDENENCEELTPKKKKKSKISQIEEVIVADEADDTIEEITPKRKKKKNKNVEIDASLDDTTPKRRSLKNKMKKRSRKLSESFDDVLEPDVSIEQDVSIDNCKEKSKKKKKSKKNKTDDSILEDDDILAEVSPEKKSKKKKKKIEEEIVSDLEMDSSQLNNSEEKTPSKKRKKSKKTRDSDIQNEMEDTTTPNTSNMTEISPKNKKSKKEKHIEIDISEIPNVNTQDISDQPKGKVIRTEYHAIDRTNCKKGYSLTSLEVESVCKNYKGSNIHQIVGYLNSGLVATEHYS